LNRIIESGERDGVNNLDKLKNHVGELHALLQDDPYSGLATWVITVGMHWQAIVELWDEGFLSSKNDN